ncbi:MAG: DMT family transporter [Bdellovibrionales bacterium]
MKRLLRSQNHTIQGILLGLGAFTLWAISDVGIKFTGKASMPPLQMIVLIALGGITFLLATTAARKKVKAFIPVNKRMLLAAGVLGLVSSFVNIITFTYLPLTTVYAALFASPMIAALMARLFMKEPLGKLQFFYIFIGFCGAVMAVNPFSADLHGDSALAWILLPIYPVLFASSTLFIRLLRRTDTNEAISLYIPLIRVVVYGPLVLLSWHPMPVLYIAVICGVGAMVSAGSLIFAQSLKLADPAVISPLHYSQLIWGTIFGYLFWQDLPAWYTITGAIIIIVSGIKGAQLASRREKELLAQAARDPL